jgi:thiol-disulfide isomerase/thioredoxin
VRAVGLALALLIAGCTLQRDLASTPPNLKVGMAAPELRGQTVEGNPVAADFHQGKSVLVFWAAWCGPCRHEQPFLNRLAAEFLGNNVRFYGVDMLDHDRAVPRAFIKEFNVAYPNIYDASGKLAAAYEVDYPPSLVLVNEKGIVVARYPGEVSEDQLRKLIREKLLT